MTKLITPVQYEAKLEACNQLRPLTIADTVQSEIAQPVLDRNPVAEDKQPGRGKCVPCSEHGAMGTYHNHIPYGVWIPLGIGIPYQVATRVDLQTRVVRFGVLWTDDGDSWACNLCTPTGTKIQRLSRTNVNWFSMNTRYVWFWNHDHPGSIWTSNIYRVVEV